MAGLFFQHPSPEQQLHVPDVVTEFEFNLSLSPVRVLRAEPPAAPAEHTNLNRVNRDLNLCHY